MKRHHLRIAWEAFMEGREPPPTLRPEVLTSWKRSQGYRIDVARSHAPLLGEAELFRRRGAHGSLLQAARPALTKARIFLADANAMVLLTDPTGLIIEASGDPRTMESRAANPSSKAVTGPRRRSEPTPSGRRSQQANRCKSTPASISAPRCSAGPARPRRSTIRLTAGFSGSSTFPDPKAAFTRKVWRTP